MRILNYTIYLAARALRKTGLYLANPNAPQIEAMKREIEKVGGRIEFRIEQYPDGSWSAQSVNIDGIITGGKTTKNLSSTIKDAIFTYFGLAPYLCDEELLKADNEPVVLTQRVYA
jgi:predicted RNase H-like HicB family nuclease